ncbi:unnamed protein product [Scytosiphon promiscuus]
MRRVTVENLSLPEAEGSESHRPKASDSRSRTSRDARGLVTLLATVGATCFAGSAWAFSSASPEPYMDEVFHVPQAQAYCRGEFDSWDPKITTPPGLYVFALAYARLAAFAQEALPPLFWAATSRADGAHEWCPAGSLRQVNWAFSLGTLAVMRALLARRMAPRKALAHALLLWLYPVSFFFSFLFYTDPGATFLVLLCYLLATGRPRGGGWGRRFGSALAGGMSVLFRQTNAVWVAFTLAVCLLEDFTPSVVIAAASPDRSREASRPPLSTPTTTRRRKKHAHDRVSPGSKTPTAAIGEPRHSGGSIADGGSDVDRGNVDTSSPPTSVPSPHLPPVPRLLLSLAGAALSDARRGAPLLRARAPLAVPVVLFAAFVWGFNGGAVVVGDKENHSPGGPPHLAQLAYLAAVGASLWGVVGGREALLGRDARRGFARWAAGTGVVGVAAVVAGVAAGLWRYSLAHPFLLSDNRHYPFYVWRRLLSRACVRVALSPIYVFCGWMMASRLLRRRPPLWVLSYAGAAAVVLVPSPLVEPRYLTIPVLLAHLESAERSWKSLAVGVITCSAVNAMTVYVFLARPFVWHDGSLARFMW